MKIGRLIRRPIGRMYKGLVRSSVLLKQENLLIMTRKLEVRLLLQEWLPKGWRFYRFDYIVEMILWRYLITLLSWGYRFISLNSDIRLYNPPYDSIAETCVMETQFAEYV